MQRKHRMNPKDIIQKLLSGSSLSDEEKSFLTSYDPDKAANDAAAAARRKAEAERDAKARELDELKAAQKAENDARSEKDKERMTEAERREAAFKALTDKVAALEKAKADADATAARVQRSSAIAAIREKRGIQFIPGVDPSITGGAFEDAFKDVDLSDDAAVTAAVGAFTAANKGLILDRSGNGSGGGFSPAAKLAAQYDAMSDSEMEKHMKESGLI